MGGGFGDWFRSTDWKGLLEHFSNDKIVSFFTRPVGLAALGVLLLLSVVNKWRVLFVILSGTMAVSFLARSTLAGAEVGPGRTLFVFAGGAIAIGAFVIYYLFIRED